MPQALSISFTLGKASVPHQANVSHANREFIARNIDRTRTNQNITYVRRDIENAYQTLFGQAVAEYNRKQKRADRKIEDYYDHISSGKREEPFYEVIVQFGDSQTAPCGSATGQIAQKMLDEYIRSFRQRNPNLYIFNAVLHLDEASPHLHINFIPFYTQGRKNGLQKGVSMKQALIEQGFAPQGVRNNQLVAWEESERNFMETILNAHGFVRDDKNAKYAHLSVEDYKKSQDEKKMIAAIRKKQHISPDEMTRSHVQRLQDKLHRLEQDKRNLQMQMLSPYKSFYYSSPDKQAFVQAALDELEIPYRETENGFEAQECYVGRIRKIELTYIAPKTNQREQLRQDIDLFLMQSASFDEMLERLRKSGYQIKNGKYLAVKPRNSEKYIRLKSLGEHYSEYALKNRLQEKLKFERDLADKIRQETKRDTPKAIILQTIRFYTITFTNGALPVRRRFPAKPFSWTNDAELDILLTLNRKINAGATLDSLRQEFIAQEKQAAEHESALQKVQNDLKSFYELKEKIEVVFQGKRSPAYTFEQATMSLKQFPDINAENYKKIDALIAQQTELLRKIEDAVNEANQALKKSSDLLSAAEKVMGGTFVQSLVGEERQRREANYVPNGLKSAGGQE